MDELEYEISKSNGLESGGKVMPKINPMERIDLINKISVCLQESMTTSDINAFMGGYGIDFEVEEVAQSKRIYVKEILGRESAEMILKIARDLDLYKDDSTVTIGQIELIDNKYIKEQVNKCNAKILSEDYDGAITNARTLVESICIYILEKSDIEYKKNGKLNQLYQAVSEYLKMQPILYESDSLRQITSGFFSIVQGLSGVRNDMSDAHGKGRNTYKAEERHAKLAVNSAHTVSDYLLESYLRLKR